MFAILNSLFFQDHREREAVRDIVHRVYLRVSHLRPEMRAVWSNIVHETVYGGRHFVGLDELLELYGLLT